MLKIYNYEKKLEILHIRKIEYSILYSRTIVLHKTIV